MLTIHGVPFSAHTRKVIITALEKGLAYRLNPVIPLDPPEGWHQLSPLGKIPVIEDDGAVVADSSVISLYLEKRYPEPAFYPRDPAAYARALWIEEFVDGALATHVLHGVLMQRVFAPRFLDQPPDEALIDASLNEHIPPGLEYLEHTLEDEWFAGSSFTIADVTVASILLHYHYAGERLSEAEHPRLHGFLRRALQRDSVRQALVAEIPAAQGVGGLDLSCWRTPASKGLDPERERETACFESVNFPASRGCPAGCSGTTTRSVCCGRRSPTATADTATTRPTSSPS